MREQVIQSVLEHKVISIVRGMAPEKILPVA